MMYCILDTVVDVKLELKTIRINVKDALMKIVIEDESNSVRKAEG